MKREGNKDRGVTPEGGGAGIFYLSFGAGLQDEGGRGGVFALLQFQRRRRGGLWWGKRRENFRWARVPIQGAGDRGKREIIQVKTSVEGIFGASEHTELKGKGKTGE